MTIYKIFRREIYFRKIRVTRVQIWLVPHHTFRRYGTQHSTHSALLPTATKLFIYYAPQVQTTPPHAQAHYLN